MSELPVGEVRVNHETKPFWDATAQGRIDLPVCDDCGYVIWYPRAFCPECQSTAVTWTTMSGRATVHSYTIVNGGVGSRWREHIPYVVAYVELAEGPRLLTNVVDVDPDAVRIGMAVEAVFDDAGDGNAVVRFAPTG